MTRLRWWLCAGLLLGAGVAGALLLRGTDLTGALVVGENLRAAVAGGEVSARGSAPKRPKCSTSRKVRQFSRAERMHETIEPGLRSSLTRKRTMLDSSCLECDSRKTRSSPTTFNRTSQPNEAPRGLSWTLEPESDLVVLTHLQPSGKPEPVQLSVALFFTNRSSVAPPAGMPSLSLSLRTVPGASALVGPAAGAHRVSLQARVRPGHGCVVAEQDESLDLAAAHLLEEAHVREVARGLGEPAVAELVLRRGRLAVPGLELADDELGKV